MTLSVINGGASAPAANGGGGPVFKMHRWAEALFDALSTKDCKTLDQIRDRMARQTRKMIRRSDVVAAMAHNRRHPLEYGWIVTYVQKGNGKNRLYWLQNADAQITASHKIAYEAGLKSAVNTVATLWEGVTSQAGIVADTDGLEQRERRKYRRVAGKAEAINTLMREIATAVA